MSPVETVPLNYALLQFNPRVGDFEANAERMLEAAKACDEAELIVFPELALCGYPPRDRLLEDRFIEASELAIEAFAQACTGLPPVLFGAATRADRSGRSYPRPPIAHNSAVLVHEGRRLSQSAKCLLPEYDVFDETRYFLPGDAPGCVTVAGRKVGILICEDAWYATLPEALQARAPRDPVLALKQAAPDLVVNLSASPFYLEKHGRRQRVMGAVARQLGVPLLYANQVGAQDGLIFEGASCAFSAEGTVLAEGPRFAEAAVRPGSQAAAPAAPLVEALTLGIRDYFRKTGHREAVLGLSGGIDSAVVLALAVRALGAERVFPYMLPSRYTADISLEDAAELAQKLRVPLGEMAIGEVFAAFEAQLAPELPAAGPGDVTFENLQSRIRGTLLMAIANRRGALLLATGNKSELATGYGTLYGDMAGALAVLGDCWKTQVYELARALNAEGHACIPERIITRAPSAELREDQKDEDSLPPYEELDAILAARVERFASRETLLAQGFASAHVDRCLQLLARAEHKRHQLPPTLIVSERAFDRGWRQALAATP